jgi:hypothetical protein
MTSPEYFGWDGCAKCAGHCPHRKSAALLSQILLVYFGAKILLTRSPRSHLARCEKHSLQSNNMLAAALG